MEQVQQEQQNYCRRQAKTVSLETCRRCQEWLPLDYDSIFNRCRIEKNRFEALYKLYLKEERRHKNE
jgi:hypothetical protein